MTNRIPENFSAAEWNRTTSANRRSSENPTKTNKREGSCNSSPALISVRVDDWLR
jgi:hypothetical protein